jgi:tetratricopeptide (TPR) repeat protein
MRRNARGRARLLSRIWMGWLLGTFPFGLACAQGAPAANKPVHTNPLNRDSVVMAAYARFYTLDYDGALRGFAKVQAAHPSDPLAADYVLETMLFHQLYDLDLLDTTLYAHDGFLTGKHQAEEDKAFTERLNAQADKALSLAETQLKADPKNVDALYARGWARSLRATYMGLVERSFLPALRMALAARSDNDRVLELDPDYVDAELVVGVHQYVVGSLPRPIKLVAGLAGIHGSKEKGLAMLRDDAEHGVTTSVEARTALSLFLRREANYAEAAQWNESQKRQYPKNFLFWLEAANLRKDAGKAQEAIGLYRAMLMEAKRPGFFVNAHLELPWYGLADTLSGQRDGAAAAAAYEQAVSQPTISPDLKRRAQLSAGEEYDRMGRRSEAEDAYRKVVALGDSTEAAEARKYLKSPFRG